MTTLPIHFRTDQNGIVAVIRSGNIYEATCEPCGTKKTSDLDITRTWANTHAKECRAIPDHQLPEGVTARAVLVAACGALFAPRRTADLLFWLGGHLDPQDDQGADATP